MNKKGLGGLVIGLIVVAVVVVGGVFLFSGGDDSEDREINGTSNSGSSGTNTGGSTAGGGSGNTGSSDSGDLGWCRGVGEIKTYKGVETCYLVTSSVAGTQEFYYVDMEKGDFWRVDTQSMAGKKYELKYENKKCVEHTCLEGFSQEECDINGQLFCGM
jgi:hypothetical protein